MKLNSLQILRAFAALQVLLTHVFQISNFKPFGDYYLSGQFGVDIFFILSGFLIFLTTKENIKNQIFMPRKEFLESFPYTFLHCFFT
ncbi:acyltransferase family protein [Flavobacterium sp.]|uniref:acyltransferase family protein n=1 Tax=Flavobacterium sp. TaxID=239 RepID=UPI0035278AB2